MANNNNIQRQQRLQEKLRQKQRHQAPFFQCFNRWLFLSRHNKIMFMERARLAMLQKEYENGLRSGESLKKEAQRIVKENLANMTTITTSCKTEAKDGREAFDVKQTLKQIWTKIETKQFISFISIREQQNNNNNNNNTKVAKHVTYKTNNKDNVRKRYIVDIYFCVSSANNNTNNAKKNKDDNNDSTYSLYNIVFLKSSLAYRFCKSLCKSLMVSDLYPLLPNKPIDGSVGIEAITLSQTANDEIKFRIVMKSAYPQQKYIRNHQIPKIQSLMRLKLIQLYIKKLKRSCNIIQRYMKMYIKKKAILEETAKKKRKKKKKKKDRKKKLKHIKKIQKFWRKYKFKNDNRYITTFSLEILEFNISVDAIISKLKPHYDEIIDKVSAICKRVREKSAIEIYGSYANGLFMPSSDIDLVVSFRSAYSNVMIPPFFEDQSWRRCVPKSVSNVGNNCVGVDHALVTEGGNDESVTFGKIWKLPSRVDDSNSSVMEELVSELAHQAGDLIRSITFVRTARIPIVKIVATSSEDVTCHVDISQSATYHGGLRACNLVKSLIATNQSIRPLIVIIKQFLKEQKLLKSNNNDGGISSYALFVLVVNCLKDTKRLNNDKLQEKYLWALQLKEFFNLYGNQIDFKTTGVSIEYGLYDLNKFGRVGIGACCIDDPISPGVTTHVLNLGENVYKISLIQNCFKNAWSMMQLKNGTLKSMLRAKWRRSNRTVDSTKSSSIMMMRSNNSSSDLVNMAKSK